MYRQGELDAQCTCKRNIEARSRNYCCRGKEINNTYAILHVCTVHQQYQGTFLLLQTDAHNYKIIGIFKQLKFRLSLRYVSVHAGTIIRELFRA